MTRRVKLSRLGVPILVAAALGVTAVIPASAVSAVKKFSEGLSIDGATAATSAIVAPSSTHTFQFVLTNSTSSNQAFGSAQILVPAVFTVGLLGPSVTGPGNF